MNSSFNADIKNQNLNLEDNENIDEEKNNSDSKSEPTKKYIFNSKKGLQLLKINSQENMEYLLNNEENENNNEENENIEKKEEEYNKTNNLNNLQEETPELTPEEKEKIEYETLLKTYNKLKYNLVKICNQIESNLNLIYFQPQNLNEASNKTQPYNSITSQITETIKKNKNVYQEIKEYKKKADEIQIELEIALKMNKVLEIESLYSEKEKQYKELEEENKSLNKVRNHQIKGLEEYQNKVLKRQELNNINQKINRLKSEIKKQREEYKMNETRYKGQLSKIDVINKRCQIIRENINYKKKEKLKEIEIFNKYITSDIKENIENDNDNIIKLKEIYKEKYDNFHSDEKEYQLAIKQQEKNKEKIQKDIEILKIKINENLRNIIINQEKEKELLKRTNLKEKKLNLINNNNKKKFINSYSYDNNTFLTGNNYNFSNNNPNFLLNQINNRYENTSLENKDKKFKYQPFNSNNRKNKKIPFDINKFMDDIQNRNDSNIPNEYDNPTLFEIENLKSEIQKTLSKNKKNEKTFKRILLKDD